jgi:hypothetical protein
MPDPFDPVRAAWILLMALVALVGLQQVFVFAGCLWGVQVLCEREGGTLAGVSGEVLAAVALLIGLGRRP